MRTMNTAAMAALNGGQEEPDWCLVGIALSVNPGTSLAGYALMSAYCGVQAT